jgi:hypothetical protein
VATDLCRFRERMVNWRRGGIVTALRLIVADHDITMGSGEVAEFDTTVPHWFGAAGYEPVELLSLLGHAGERIHVRAEPRRRTAGA